MSTTITGKPYINFEVFPTYDPQIIILMDYSEWKILQNQPSVIRITLPGSTQEIIQTWAKDRVNRFNSVNLGTSCLTECDEQVYADLPDGIYQFTLEGSPTTYNKKRYYLKMDSFQLELDKIYIKANIEYSTTDKPLREALELIEFHKNSAESFTRRGDFVRADRSFCEAQKILRKYQDCKDCI